MNIIEIITKKKNNEILSKQEIQYVIDNLMNKNIKDYQMSALLMAIVINKMNSEETINLTEAMINSGSKLDLSSIEGIVVDKHSTGGVGDKTTLILAPLIASLDIKMAKMSGRGLGHTGGTIDKLESIESFEVKLTKEQFLNQINDIGVAITSQTENIAPADKIIYALRDVTGTTESIPLIASSIMSKKIASGAKIIVIDVKVGNGALMKNEDDARELSKLMIEIGDYYNRKVICVLTNMEEPLGNAIGNSLEVLESINTLKGNGPVDLEKLVVVLATIIVEHAKNLSTEEAKSLVLDNLKNGQAYNKFEQLIKYQNGNIDHIKTNNTKIISVKTSKDGFINKINAMKLGELARTLGAGRASMEENIDYGVGIVLHKKVGDFVFENEELVKIYINKKDISVSEIVDCFEINEEKMETKPLIIDIINN
ncbi:MAG: thymidine phosphorylase [Bacilli bacterium]